LAVFHNALHLQQADSQPDVLADVLADVELNLPFGR